MNDNSASTRSREGLPDVTARASCENCRRPVTYLAGFGWVHGELPQYAGEEATCAIPGRALTVRDRIVLDGRRAGKTLKEIAAEVGLTRERVRQLEQEARLLMGENIASRGPAYLRDILSVLTSSPQQMPPPQPKPPRPPPPHGTLARYSRRWKCRCTECRAANAAQQKAGGYTARYREKRRKGKS